MTWSVCCFFFFKGCISLSIDKLVGCFFVLFLVKVLKKTGEEKFAFVSPNAYALFKESLHSEK